MSKQREKFVYDYTKYLTNKYSIPLCKALQPYQPDLKKANRLGRKYFYDREIIKYLQCYAESITVEPHQGLGAVGRLITKYDEGQVLASGASGRTFLLNENIVVKTPLFGEEEENLSLKYEFIVGSLLNQLQLSNFMYTYGILSAPLPNYVRQKGLKGKSNDDEEFEIKSVGIKYEKEAEVGQYLLLEYIRGHSYHYMSGKWARESKFHEILVCFLQIFYTLWIANENLGFVHGDLHSANLLIIELEEYVCIPYFLPNGDTVVIKTPYVVKIIDYGFATLDAKVPEEMKQLYGKKIRLTKFLDLSKHHPIDVNLRTPFYDLHKIAGSTLDKLSENPILFKIFTVVVDYIYTLKKYYTEDRKFIEIKKPTKNDTFYALTRSQRDEVEETLSMLNYHKYLQKILFGYLKVKYVFLNETNVGGESLWLTCEEKQIQQLVQKGYHGLKLCRNEKQVFEEMSYQFYTIFTVGDFIEREKPSKIKLEKDFGLQKIFSEGLQVLGDEVIQMKTKKQNYGQLEAQKFLYKIRLISNVLQKINMYMNYGEGKKLKGYEEEILKSIQKFKLVYGYF